MILSVLKLHKPALFQIRLESVQNIVYIWINAYLKYVFGKS